MNSRIVYSNDDGGINILVPAPVMFDENSRDRQELKEKGIIFKDDSEVLNWIIAKDVPNDKAYRVIDVSDLPSFRDFRNAWIDTGSEISHDMAKANEIKRDQLREIRKPILEKLDVDYMQADEVKDENTKIDIASKKQALRDVTAFVDMKDVEALKNYVPDVLKQ